MFLPPRNASCRKLKQLLESNDDVELEEVMLHPGFENAIETESDFLYQRILLNDDEPWFYKIVNYAIFNAAPPKKFKKLNTYNQINKNAGHFLENCGKKFAKYFTKKQSNSELITPVTLHSYLNDSIKKFISDGNELNIDPMYSGHFQRFINNFIRCEFLDIYEYIHELILFLVDKIHVLAYQQLITTILSDYVEKIGIDIIYELLTQILNRCYLAVNYIKQNTKSIKKDVKQKFNIKKQPINVSKNPLPHIEINFKDKEFVDDLNNPRVQPKIQWKKGIIEKSIKDPKYERIEDAEVEVYLLLMAIRQPIIKCSSIIDIFREHDEANKYPLTEALFFIGTRSRSESIVQLEAFRILSLILNGSAKYGIQRWLILEEEKQSQLDFYNKYADEMIYDPNNFTHKMVSSLPIFWSHRYNKDEYKMSKEEKEVIDTSEYYNNDGDEHSRKREKGETAFEILQPCAISEPPISSQLIYNYLDIFNQIFWFREKLFNEKSPIKSHIDLTVSLDGLIVDFYQHHFYYGEDFPDSSFSDLICKKAILPMEPMSKYYIDISDKKRAVLNGFIVELLLQMTSMKSNKLFQLQKHNLSKLGRCKCLYAINMPEIIVYRDYTNIQPLPKEKMKRNKIIVDEFDEEEDPNNKDDKDSDSMPEGLQKIKIFVDDLAKPKIVKPKGESPKVKLIPRGSADIGDDGKGEKPKSPQPKPSAPKQKDKKPTPRKFKPKTKPA